MVHCWGVCPLFWLSMICKLPCVVVCRCLSDVFVVVCLMCSPLFVGASKVV